MTLSRIAVIGAGITGLTCARLLAQAGLAPVVFDKGRGLGGRLATRRAGEGLQFDHGAPFVTATDPGFVSLLDGAMEQGAAARWPLRDPVGSVTYVGLPGMSGLLRPLAKGLDIRNGATVTALSAMPRACRIAFGDRTEEFGRVILTIPAPQALRLLGADHPLAAPLRAVNMTPCLTLMAAFGPDGPVEATPDPDGTFAQLLPDSTKPGRDQRNAAWVAHASAAVTGVNLENDMAEVTSLLLPRLCARLGQSPDSVRHAATHRWRYARTAAPLGQPLLADGSGRLFLGGDWCLGPDAEHGWHSGQALAAAVLASL